MSAVAVRGVDLYCVGVDVAITAAGRILTLTSANGTLNVTQQRRSEACLDDSQMTTLTMKPEDISWIVALQARRHLRISRERRASSSDIRVQFASAPSPPPLSSTCVKLRAPWATDFSFRRNQWALAAPNNGRVALETSHQFLLMWLLCDIKEILKELHELINQFHNVMENRYAAR